jgi:diaminopropionate ammonia-lyase
MRRPSRPRWVIDGYATILREVDDDLQRLGEPGPNVVVAQIGVGAFAAAVTRHFRRATLSPQPLLIGVEPVGVACVLRSIEAGEITEVPGPHRSIMTGLNCGLPSPVAWPVLRDGVDWFLAIGDEWARDAMRLLARSGVVAGESGAAGLAGLLALGARAGDGAPQLDSTSRVLIFNTEGGTDPEAYARIVDGARDAPPRTRL